MPKEKNATLRHLQMRFALPNNYGDGVCQLYFIASDSLSLFVALSLREEELSAILLHWHMPNYIC